MNHIKYFVVLTMLVAPMANAGNFCTDFWNTKSPVAKSNFIVERDAVALNTIMTKFVPEHLTAIQAAAFGLCLQRHQQQAVVTLDESCATAGSNADVQRVIMERATFCFKRIGIIP